MTIVTRFAPSPTGFLHIGGARTALFNWMLARHTGGRFLLRIEDTDRKRSTQEAIDAIFAGMRWLGLDWDGDAVFQSTRIDRHRQVAEALLAEGKAYRCYASQEELAAMREQAQAEGRSIAYDRRWRDRDPSEAPAGVDPVIRIKAPIDQDSVIDDAVQGRVTVPAGTLDDFVLMRADGTPTYMLAVVVDDHDMGVTHVVRGDDHLNNAFRQKIIIDAMGWPLPVWGHVPLIHGADGAKMSKRHGATGVEEYRDQGYLPETVAAYLLRLGWSHGDDEYLNIADAIADFGLSGIGRSPARFDQAKLNSMSGQTLQRTDPERLLPLLVAQLESKDIPVDEAGLERLRAGLPSLVERATTLIDLADASAFLVRPRPLPMTDAALKLLTAQNLDLLAAIRDALADLPDFSAAAVDQCLRDVAAAWDLKLRAVMPLARVAVVGDTQSPSLGDVLAWLGRDEALARIGDCLQRAAEA